MKKIIFLLVALFYSFSLGQEWNDTETPISESTLEKMDLFTNKDGNHLLIKRANGNIVYYNINSLGTVTISNTTLESNGDFPTITGTNDRVYAFYKAGNYIKMKYSTSGGTNWIYSSNLDIDIGSNECNGIDAVFENERGVHIAWATKDSDPYFETYYYRLNTYTTPFQWTEGKTVTDYSQYEVGGAPTIVYSNNRVHVSYNLKYSGQPLGAMKTRDRDDGSWQTPQFISTVDESVAEKLVVRDSYLYAVYGKYISPEDDYVDLVYKSRTLSGTWSSGTGTVIDYAVNEDQSLLNVCKTFNDNLQLVYSADSDFLHRSFNGSWSGTFPIDENQTFDVVPSGLSNTSNDVFVTWKRYSDNYIRYRHYDAVPLAPQGLAVQPHQIGSTLYAKLTWQLNNEPDVYIKQNNAYEIWRRISSLGIWSSWSVVANASGDITEFIDYEVQGVGTADIHTVEYKMKVRDYKNNVSDFSSVVSIEFEKYSPSAPGRSGGWANKSTESSGNSISYDYDLAQNYPNPFNPTTTINYATKFEGLVTLKVYDMLGTEVASLVDERKEPGNYTVEFYAGNLPSGIYFYTLTSGNFMATKKLILLK